MGLDRIDHLEQEYRALRTRVDRLDQLEKSHDFTIRDSSVKIGIAEGLAETTHKELAQLKFEMIQARAEIKELRYFVDQHFDRLEQKMDAQHEDTHKRFDKLESLIKQALSRD